MSLSIEDCKDYTSMDVFMALQECDVILYENFLRSRVNEMCLQLGLPSDSTEEGKMIANKVIQEIEQFTDDQTEKDKLYNYANKLINLGLDYLVNHQDIS